VLSKASKSTKPSAFCKKCCRKFSLTSANDTPVARATNARKLLVVRFSIMCSRRSFDGERNAAGALCW
jgi:hypothetical protein